METLGDGDAHQRHRALGEDEKPSVLEVADSDDDERLEELAAEKETSYWSFFANSSKASEHKVSQEIAAVSWLVGTPAIGPDFVLPQTLPAAAMTTEKYTVEEIMPSSFADNATASNESFLAASSPDPMDLLAVGTEALSGKSSPAASSVLDKPSQIQENTAQMVEDNAADTLVFPQPLVEERPSSPNLPIPANVSRDRSLSVISEDLPSLSQSLLLAPSVAEISNKIGLSGYTDGSVCHQLQQNANQAKRKVSSADETDFSSTSTASPHIAKAPKRMAFPLTPPQLEDLPIDDDFVGGRRLRKRTAAQKNPYQSEFAKYVQVARRNQWDGIIIPAGLNLSEARTESSEERAARIETQKKKKINTQGGWLELEAGEGIALRSDEEEHSQRPSHEFASSGEEESRFARRRRSSSNARFASDKAKDKGPYQSASESHTS